MKNNRFYLSVIIRIVLITCNSFVLIWFFTQTSRPATTMLFLILLIIQSMILIRFLNRINRDLANFLVYLQENDTSLSFSRNRIEKNFKNVMTGLNEINQKIHEARISREEKNQYLKAVIEHVETGILTFNTEGKVELVNKAALDILGRKSLQSIHSIGDKFMEIQDVLLNSARGSSIKMNTEGRSVNLSVKINSIRLGEKQIRIASLQNIKAELDEQELESWRKLIRILRHEIMNSITPITTLTIAIKRCFSNSSGRKPLKVITEANIEDALASTKVIEERSKGMISFVEKFRSITELPQPVIQSFPLKKLFDRIRLLFQNLLEEKKINLLTEDCNLHINADEPLIEQVIINMVKNSVEALDDNGEITLKAYQNEKGQTYIQVMDTGKGILPEDLENIFVPSFSTKENNMGVGLSISKQIIQMHHGEIFVNSIPGLTVFEIQLNR